MAKYPWRIANEELLKPTNIGEVLSFKNRKIGEIVEVKVKVPAKLDVLTLEIFVKGVKKDWLVVTSGWHTWSGRETRGKDVGISDFPTKLAKMKTEFTVEPGSGKVSIPEGVGQSYGYVVFRSKSGAKNFCVGIIPSLKEVEDIRFKLVRGGVSVMLRKNLEKLDHSREVAFKVFLARGMFIEEVFRFGQELSKFTKLKLMNNRLLWFTWASYGKGVTQKFGVENELPYLKELGVDTLIIDDGWEPTVGQWEFDKKDFPDVGGMIKKIKSSGIKPGIWVAPFMAIRESEVSLKHPDWLMKDGKGRLLNVSNPQIQPTGRIRPFVEPAIGLDISIPEVREYLYGVITHVAKMGFEVFKFDFVSIPFVGELKNKDKTSVEYYRLFFQELRKRLGKNIEFIGCGAPMMESIGLFEGMRVTADSAMPNLSALKYYGGFLEKLHTIPFVSDFLRRHFSINTVMYRDATAVVFRRAYLFGKAFGLLVDGVHLSDPKIYIDPEAKRQMAEALPAFKWLGVLTNLFVGDSLVRCGVEGREVWKRFLAKYKLGERAWIEERTGNVWVK